MKKALALLLALAGRGHAHEWTAADFQTIFSDENLRTTVINMAMPVRTTMISV